MCLQQCEALENQRNHVYKEQMMAEVKEPVIRADHATTNSPDTMLANLLSYNQARIDQFKNSPFCQLAKNRVYDDAKKRLTFLSFVKKFAECFQTALFCRQATCADIKYEPTFLEHLKEEIGHVEILPKEINKIEDPIIEGMTSWFCYKMLTLDNVEKAVIMHLVLEASGETFWHYAAPAFRNTEASNFFNLHADADEDHYAVGIDLLKSQHPEVYKRLLKIMEEAWNMLEAMFDRVVFLVEKA